MQLATCNLIPDFVVVGHLTRDEQPDGSYTLGGAATFAAIAARQLGLRAAILTSAAENFPEPALLRDIEIVRLTSPTTTTFRNIYHQGTRRQHVHDVAGEIRAEHLPDDWRAAKIALLGPLVRELDVDFVHAFSEHTLIGVSPQGWMRQWDETGRVSPREWFEAADILPHAAVLVLSEEDLGPFASHLDSYIELAPLVILTEGYKGCTVYRKDTPPLYVPAFPSDVLDPTGAGDTFATGFLIRYYETQDILQSARFANATASLAIESIGAENMPTRAQVEERLASNTDNPSFRSAP